MSSPADRILADRNPDAPELQPLNLIFDYPVRWDRFKVLRDFLQNFYDAVGHVEWGQRFSHRVEDDQLVFVARDVGFSHEWLAPIGASTKRDAPGTYAGYFGEGFKIAALCAVRDHGWRVEMASRDWELQVATHEIVIDGRRLKSLAYRVWKSRPPRRDTVLRLQPFRPFDEAPFEAALHSFYHAGNPLFGREIWSTATAAVWRRSKVPKPAGYPSTYDLRGEGILFAGFQAMGSFPFPLVIAVHDLRHNDRERHAFYEMDVVDAIKRICDRAPPDSAIPLLEAFRSKWYCYPRKKYDFESWHPIIARLARRVGESEEARRQWRDRHPRLLVAEKVKRAQLAQWNRRKQALAWRRQDRPDFRLVPRPN